MKGATVTVDRDHPNYLLVKDTLTEVDEDELLELLFTDWTDDEDEAPLDVEGLNKLIDETLEDDEREYDWTWSE